MTQPRRWILIAAGLTLGWSACSTVDCPSGSVERQGQCVPIDTLQPDGGPAAGAGGEGGAAGSSGGGAGGAGTGGAGAGGSSGAAAGGGGMAGSGDDACSTPDAVRCSTQGAGARETCTDGVWTASAACGSGETCVADPSGQASCVTIAELCQGHGGQTVCDAQGSLIVCNANESIETMMACVSAKHCEAGKASKTCPICLPTEEFRCTGVSLEQCSEDGMTFAKITDCDNEALCNKLLGTCTDAVCEAGETACDGDSLVMCNADGTAIVKTTPCAAGMCDAEGGDCNTCLPGTKKCENNQVMTCDAAGQTYVASACPSNTPNCRGGQCWECTAPGTTECDHLTQGCKVGRCSENACITDNAPNGSGCTTAGGMPGTCSTGTCQCTRQCDGRTCGPDGCGGSCGPCSDMCIDGQCVECRNDNDCNGLDSSGGCTYGECNNGDCMERVQPATESCTVGNQTGMCDGSGACCISNCTQDDCGNTDNCGRACPNRCSQTSRVCNTNTDRCELPPTIGGLYSACGVDEDCPTGALCTQIGPGSRFCYTAYNAGCPSGMIDFLQSVCLVPCADGCPLGAPECYEEGLGGVCVPDDGE